MQISIGMSLARGAGKIISYLLRDEFTTDRAAGAVNGTAAEPGPGTRAVVDASGRVDISGGNLRVIMGESNGGAGYIDPLIYGSAQNRQAGLVFVLKELQATTRNKYNVFGFRNALDTGYLWGFSFRTSQEISVFNAELITSPGITVSTTPINGSYAVVLRSSGLFLFVKISNVWMLLYSFSASNTSSLYPFFSAYTENVTYTMTGISVSNSFWLPTPLASDGFASAFGLTDGLGHAEGVAGGIGAGGIGLTWTGATWSVSGAKAINTPTLSSELLTNGNTETGNPPTGWTAGTNVTLSGAADERTGGSGSQSLSITNTDAGSFGRATQTLTGFSVGQWVLQQGWVRRVTAPGANLRIWSNGFGNLIGNRSSTSTSWTNLISTDRIAGSTPWIFAPTADAGNGQEARFDDLSVRTLTLSSLFASVSLSTADVVADVNVVVTAGTQAGLVLNLDSTGTPANFVIAYHDGTNAKLEKCVAGVYTTVITAAATYSAGATLRVTKIGTAYRLYYNNALVGSGTISDAGIISNTRHGLFSTYEANTLDNFVVYASGSGGEYAVLDQY